MQMKRNPKAKKQQSDSLRIVTLLFPRYCHPITYCYSKHYNQIGYKQQYKCIL